MDQKPVPRDPHPDNDLIDAMVEEGTAGQSSASGGRLATEIGSRDEARGATGGDPEPTRATKQDKPQPQIAARADDEAQDT